MATKSDSTRARARRGVAEVHDRKRAEQKAKEARIDLAAVEFAVGVEQVRQAEVRCGRAIEALYAQGLSATEVAEWCGDITVPELRRLRQLAQDEPVAVASAESAAAASGEPVAESKVAS